MVIQASKSPDFKELIQDLKSHFGQCAVYEFGSKPTKSIIVRKSATVGAQLTIRENEINVVACYPNLFISTFMSLVTASTIFPFNSWPAFEKKVLKFLSRKYGNAEA
jgi:hypothetical protein